MAARQVRKNFNLFVDGRGYAGQVEEFNAPKLSLKLEEFRAGGMAAPVELTMGMEKLECDFSLVSYDKDVLKQFNLAEGFVVPLVLREALEDFDGTITAVVHTMRGKVKEVDPGTSKSGDKTSLKFAMALTYYKLEHGGDVVHELDVENLIQNINGKDVLAATRAALGF